MRRFARAMPWPPLRQNLARPSQALAHRALSFWSRVVPAMAPQQMAFVDELKDLNEHSGKQFYASDRLVPDWESPRFPSLSTESLASSAETIQLPEHFKGEVTLVALSYKDIGAQALPSWIEPFMSSVGSYGSGAGGGRARRDPGMGGVRVEHSWCN